MFEYLIVGILIIFAASLIIFRIKNIIKNEDCNMCSKNCSCCDSQYIMTTSQKNTSEMRGDGNNE